MDVWTFRLGGFVENDEEAREAFDLKIREILCVKVLLVLVGS